MSTIPTRLAAPFLVLVLTASVMSAQSPPSDRARPDSVTIPASTRYERSALFRWLFGDGYRDLWATPIRVAVLDLDTFDGGLVPEELGGGNATLSLHLDAEDGSEYVFRTVDKNPINLPGMVDDVKFAAAIARDRTASTHPAANLVHTPFFRALGIIHDDDPMLFVMPDHERLGEYRELMAGRLGVMIRHAGKNPQLAREYAGAVELVDTDTLLQRLNRDPADHIHVNEYLAARMLDILLNNWDRHPGNWKWARLEEGGVWHPIARDMDNIFVSQDGFLPKLARSSTPKLLTFDSTYPPMRSITYKGGILDRRFLMGTSRSVFDSVARVVQSRVTDQVIAEAMAMMPTEYAASQPPVVAKLRMRRDSLPAVVGRWYHWINAVADIHATDKDDLAMVQRLPDGAVEVRLATPSGRPFFERRFDPAETEDIRLYLHEGDDRVSIRGEAARSIRLRVIGGNGMNTILDSSRVGGRSGVTEIHDAGPTSGIDYGVDTVWNRRPLVTSPSGKSIAFRDYGGSSGPVVDVSTGRDHGLMPELGWEWKTYGFRKYPYASRLAIAGRYSFRNDGFAVELNHDRRVAESRMHYTMRAQFSQLELLNYHGLGNATPGTPGVPLGDRAPRDGFFAVHQEQWLLHPAVALSLAEKSEVQVGPVVKHSSSNGTPGGFLEISDPYGAGDFGQAGLRASFRHDTRDRSSKPRSGVLLDAYADYYPAIWDVESDFAVLHATGGAYVTMPLPLKPYLGLRVIASRSFGDFPFHESAFLGARSGGVRSLDPQRYAGDAAISAKLELRVPLFDFYFILPLEVGAFAAEEVGRVYVNGASPGGWHDTFGAGFWLAFRDIALSIRLIERNEAFSNPEPSLRIGTSVGIPQ